MILQALYRKCVVSALVAVLLGLCVPGRSAPPSSEKAGKGGAAVGKATATAPAAVKICFTPDPPPFAPDWLEEPTSATATYLDPDQDKDEIVRARRLVQEELTRYPTALLNRNLRYVYMVKSLSEEDTEVGGLNSPEDKKLYLEDTGVYDEPMERYIRSSIHHEFAHVLLTNYADRFSRENWSHLNNAGFEYGDGGLESIKADPNEEAELDPASWEEGFAYPYGKSDIDEDVACLAEGLFSGNPEFWQAVDRVPVLNKKVKALIAFYHSLDNTLTETYFRQMVPFAAATDPTIAARYAAEQDDDDERAPQPDHPARRLALILLGLFLVGGVGLTVVLAVVLSRNRRQPRSLPSGPSPWLTTHLWHVVMQNDLVGTEDALTRGADPNSRDGNGAPLLVAALLSGHPRTAVILLQFHADVHAAMPQTGVTPLMAACSAGAMEMVEALLVRGAHVDAQSPEGACALGYAACNGHAEIVTRLLQYGANPYLADRFGTTARLAAQRQLAQTTDPYRSAALMQVLERLPG